MKTISVLTPHETQSFRDRSVSSKFLSIAPQDIHLFDILALDELRTSIDDCLSVC